ncbi:hypothetical protein MKW94_001032 [Papaver nudicaule]|uniref:Pentatricopeptide repeat-containing protein n=1 Tax=Papaver nudicaule TaxID=74823 RepID=A0AA41RWA3_PAPNU|nr:hypothetical protein [Papaver nudicaule]
MDSVLCNLHPTFERQSYGFSGQSVGSQFTSFTSVRLSNSRKIVATVTLMKAGNSHHKLTKNLRYPRRAKLPPDPRSNLFFQKNNTIEKDLHRNELQNIDDEDGGDDDDGLEWSADEIDAISSLFQGRIPQKPGELNRERPLPLPLPYKLRPLGLPTPKRHVRMVTPMLSSSRASVCRRVYKNPEFLVHLAKEIRSLPSDKNVSEVLSKWVRFLRKGSLSLTIRELGHMGLPDRALQTFCWAQQQPQLFPDDRILASTVEILARTRELKMPFDLQKFTSTASRPVIEALARGFIRGGSLYLARKLLLVAKDNNRTLDASIHAKLILELGKNPDKYKLVLTLLDELGGRDGLELSQQDCTSVMKVCIKLEKYDVVESLYSWFKESGREPSIVMHTTMIHSRYKEQKYREAFALIWEMEESNCLFDLPAYHVVIKLFVALKDLPRAGRYFSRLKEAGFAATYDIYRDMIKIYAVSGRLAKCKELCKEIEKAGFKLDKQVESLMLQMIKDVGSVKSCTTFK